MPLRCHPGSTLAEARAAARRLLLPLLAFALLAGAAAQPAEARVGVIASRTGSASAAGTAQWLLASDWARELQAQGGVFGVPVRLELRDDASSAPAARAHAQELVDAGALLLVCCTTPAASQAVAELAEAAGVPLLAPSALEPAAPYPYWAFTLFPDETDALAAIVADAYREGRPALALMAIVGLYGLWTWRGLRIAWYARDVYGRVLAVGLTAWVVFQAAVHVGVLTATIPFTGTVLPFISYGGSSLSSSILSAGLLLSISRDAGAPEEEHAS